MRRLALMTLLIIGLVFSSTGAHAALFNLPGDALALDSNTGQSWIRDLSTFGSGAYDEQQFAINVLNQVSYSGLSDWHMATLTDMQALWSYSAEQIELAFFPNWNPPKQNNWTGRYDSLQTGSNPEEHYTATVSKSYNVWYPGSSPPPGWQPYSYSQGTLETFSTLDTNAFPPLGAWVVSGYAPAVPIPGTIWLLGSGLAGILAWRKRAKRS